MPKSTIEVEIEFGETDAAGIVFYPNYFRWFDHGTHHLLGTIGLPHTELLEKFRYAQPVIDCGCIFTRPLRYGDKVQIETIISEVNETTFKLNQLVFRNYELVGSGYETRTWVKIDETGPDGRLKVIPIPPDMAEKLKGKTNQWARLEALQTGGMALD